MEPTEFERRLLEHIYHPNYQPVKPRVIAKQLGLAREEMVQLRRALKRLARQGRVVYGDKHIVRRADPESPKSTGGRVRGVYRRSSQGYGFVRPDLPAVVSGEDDGTGPSGEPSGSTDIYIAAGAALDAADGDTVIAQVSGRRHGPRDWGPRGRIVEIVARRTTRFVGTFLHSGGTPFVQVDGDAFERRVPIGDVGDHRIRAGDKVLIEMTRFPSPDDPGRGVIVKVFGGAGTPGVPTQIIISEFNLPDEFEEETLEDARHQAAKFTGEVDGDRVDLTDRVVVTIDPIDARDFDDAVSLSQNEAGHWVLEVHIADVAHFVPAGSPLDREAYDRATSVYLPDRVIPMLPETISNAMASLQPGELRYTKTVRMEMTPDGALVDVAMMRSAIRSTRRLVYEDVDEFLQQPDSFREEWGEGVCSLLVRMYNLAIILRGRRRDRGSLEIHMPDVSIRLDRKGCVTGARVIEQTESRRIIEEFMVAANEAVAAWLTEREVPFLRRVHLPPSPRKLRQLTDFVREIGLHPGNLQSRFELQSLLDEAADRKESHAVNFATLRAMQRAVYSPAEDGHFALASEDYCHFTSPIRRYPDLTVHRLIDTLLAGGTHVDHESNVTAIGQHCSDRERRAEDAERQLTKLLLLHYMEDRIGEEMDVVITGVRKFGLFVQGLDLPAEGLLPVEMLGDDHFQFDRATHTLAGFRSGNTYRLGDRLKAVVMSVDTDRRQLDFRLAGDGRPKRDAERLQHRGAREPYERPRGKKGRRRRR